MQTFEGGANMEKETFWSKYAENFEETNNYVVGKKSMDVILDKVSTFTNLGDCLEVACGNGTYTKTLSENADNIIATDFSIEMISWAEKALSHLENVEFKQANALNLPFPDNSFDTVFMANFLHVTTDCNKLLSEANRILKKGGKLIAVDLTVYKMKFFDRLGLIYRYIKTYKKPDEKPEKNNLTPYYVRKLLEENNFTEKSIELVGAGSNALITVALKN